MTHAKNPSPEQVVAARRQRAGVINRWLGWIILPLVLSATIIHFSPDGDTGTRNTIVTVVQSIYVAMILVHVILSFYVFGWVRPSRTLRVFHVWFGYAYVLLVLASQTTFGISPLHGILTTAMFTCLFIHVGIGVYYAKRRRQARVSAISFPA